ncbi:MAG TPA: tryptophan halogenase family protein [Polyangiaceae bacterium]|jgi:tryptophan halogenase|nr:tryptophan halogenase family protein [Polyangiaceae bacterium]
MKRVGSIAIVGGGSAGWMAAAYLSKVLVDVKVTLVESAKIPTIGVGEATTPMIHNFLTELGFTSPDQWMPACDATYKTGILFENWFEKGDRYWHPFELLDYVDDHTHTGHCWLTKHAVDGGGFRDRGSFAEQYFCSTTLNVGHNRMPLYANLLAYHFDAAKFGKLLQGVSPAVNHVVDEVIDVPVDDQGNIAALVTAEHGRIEADLYIDCTGFRRQLIGKADPEQKVQSWQKALFNDRAFVVRIPYGEKANLEERLHPYVKASAQSAGWVWSIPLFDRMSHGYVYSSNFLSDADAEREMEKYCGDQFHKSAVRMQVRFVTGKLPHLWAKNCVAIGLAGGFVEPLESSGLAITQVGIDWLASMLDARYYDERIVNRYNMHLDKFYLDIIHFITAHYCFTSREDTPYWKAVKNDTHVEPALQQRLDVFRRLLPTGGTKGTRETGTAFRDLSWFCVLLGMNFKFDVPKVGDAALAKAEAIAREKRKRTKELLGQVPNHWTHLSGAIYKRGR